MTYFCSSMSSVQSMFPVSDVVVDIRTNVCSQNRSKPNKRLNLDITKPHHTQNLPSCQISGIFKTSFVNNPQTEHVWFHQNLILALWCHTHNLPYSTPLRHFLNKYRVFHIILLQDFFFLVYFLLPKALQIKFSLIPSL